MGKNALVASAVLDACHLQWMLRNRLLRLVGPTVSCGSSSGSCWRADGLLVCFQDGCCFPSVLGQSSSPTLCLRSVAPGVEFT